jgi:hypothetical protein
MNLKSVSFYYKLSNYFIYINYLFSTILKSYTVPNKFQSLKYPDERGSNDNNWISKSKLGRVIDKLMFILLAEIMAYFVSNWSTGSTTTKWYIDSMRHFCLFNMYEFLICYKLIIS